MRLWTESVQPGQKKGASADEGREARWGERA